jgi:hypothetical protein
MLEVSFVVAMPGWEVLTYVKGGQFETAPIVSWAIVGDTDTETFKLKPVTAALTISVDEDFPICSPDGDVTEGITGKWATVWQWLVEMQDREARGTLDERPTAPPPPDAPNTVVLDTYRRKFQQPPGDAL